MERFLKKMDSLGKYDFLILDMGNHLCRENKKLLAGADCAVLISDGERSRPGKYREKISREIFKRVERGRLLYVKNFVGDDWTEEDTRQLCITKMCIRDRETRRGKRVSKCSLFIEYLNLRLNMYII